MTAGRSVIHLAYADLRARLALITGYLPRLQSNSPLRRWFFVDVPVGTTSGLEVVQLHPPADRLARSDLVEWLASCRATDLITSATFADASLVLQPAFFPNGQVPRFCLATMASCSARAAVLLGQHGGPVPEDTVATEISALYAEFFPRRADRHLALDLYATWLEHTASGTVVDRASQSSPTGSPLGKSIGVVARLAQIQAVRLRGPDYPGGLIQEAALVRSLLRGETDPSTWSATATGT